MAFGRISRGAGMAFGVDKVGFQRMQATIFQMHKLGVFRCDSVSSGLHRSPETTMTNLP